MKKYTAVEIVKYSKDYVWNGVELERTLQNEFSQLPTETMVKCIIDKKGLRVGEQIIYSHEN